MLLFEFLAVGAWGFWALIALSAIFMSELMDNDKPIVATLVAIGTLAALAVLGNFSPLPWIAQNPWSSALYVAAYFAVGTAWSVLKWYFWLLKSRRRLDEIRTEHQGTTSYEASVILKNAGLASKVPPKVGDHKARIMGWMMLWPASMVWTVLNDPVRWVFEEIYARIGGGLQRISNHVFRDVVS